MARRALDSSDEEVTQRAFLTESRLKLSRLQLDQDLTASLRQLTEISAQAIDVARVSVWLLDAAKGQLRPEAQFDRAQPSAPPVAKPLEALPRYLAAVREQRFLAFDDVRTDPLASELAAEATAAGVSARLDAAIYRSGVVVGVVSHEHVGPPRTWKREERQFAATVADLAANFLEVRERLEAQRRVHQLELKLKDARRLDAIGRMAAGVAHDLNNVLTTFISGIELLKRESRSPVLGEMASAADHATALVRQLLALGRNRAPEAVVQPLDPLLEEVAQLVGTRQDRRLVQDVEPGLSVYADGRQLVQVLMNLIGNAFQAMKPPAAVVLRAKKSREGVVLEVIDTGEGIAKENLERLFDPFFTTRPGGYGIGLALVQQIVSQHGGEIHVSSAVGDGTTMRVLWPVAASASTP